MTERISCREEDGRTRIRGKKERDKQVLWRRSKTDYFPERDKCIPKRMKKNL